METLVTAIAGVLLSAPAIVAYRHPAAYKTLCGYFWIVAGVVALALQLWDFATRMMYHAMHPFIDRGMLEAAEKAADAFRVLNWKWLVGWTCLGLYLGFLGLLPQFGIVAPNAVKKAPASDEASRAP